MRKRKVSMPFWCVQSTAGDPFGGGVLDRITPLETCDLLCEAKSQGLIDYTATHDDNLVPWDPANSMDDRDEKSATYATLRDLKARMDKVGLRLMMTTCDLHSNQVFRNGGLTNPDPDIRLLAAQKVMRAIRIADFFGSEYLTYWVARDGFESPFALPWERSFQYIVDGLNLATRYIKENRFSVRHGTIESKPNEPRSEMLLPTTGHALALISLLEDPGFWGVNPEILQHEAMTNLSPFVAVALAVQSKKLFFLHLGNQKAGQFDNDYPTMVGMGGLKETIGTLWLLDRMGWEGHIEFDNHTLRTDATPGEKSRLAVRRDFIRANVENYRAAEKKAAELTDDSELAKLQKAIWDKPSASVEALHKLDTKRILEMRVDYKKLNETPVSITQLDSVANRRILGLA